MFRFSYLQKCAIMLQNWKLLFSKNLEVSGSSAHCTFCLSWTKMQLWLIFDSRSRISKNRNTSISGSFWFQSPLYFAHVFTIAPESEADGMLFWKKVSISFSGTTSHVLGGSINNYCGMLLENGLWLYTAFLWLTMVVAWIKMLCHLPQKTPDAQRSSNTITVPTAQCSEAIVILLPKPIVCSMQCNELAAD